MGFTIYNLRFRLNVKTHAATNCTLVSINFTLVIFRFGVQLKKSTLPIIDQPLVPVFQLTRLWLRFSNKNTIFSVFQL